MTRKPFLIALCLVLACGLTRPAGSELIRNPVVPNAKLGELRHGTYPSPGIGDWTHAGVDLVAPCGSAIFAFADGKVTDVIANERDPNFKALGYMVLLEHPAKLVGKPFHTLYLHMQSPPSVKQEEQVRGGQTILGKIGQTGKAFGCHTHFEIRYFSARLSKWANIYGPGDQRQSSYFKQNWADPIAFFERWPDGLAFEVIKQGGQQIAEATSAQGNPAVRREIFDLNRKTAAVLIQRTNFFTEAAEKGNMIIKWGTPGTDGRVPVKSLIEFWRRTKQGWDAQLAVNSYTCLQELGYLNMVHQGPGDLYSISVTDKGQTIGQVVEDSSGYARYVFPLWYRMLRQATGIKKTFESSAIVQFEWQPGNFNEVFRCAVNPIPNFETKTGQATLGRYDDGWRVEEIR